MAWIYLLIAAGFEIGWPFGLKMAGYDSRGWWWIAFALVAMAFSGWFLFIAQKHIPIGTAYAVWTGLGAAGTFAFGVWYFGDHTTLMSWLGLALIISGVALLKLAH